MKIKTAVLTMAAGALLTLVTGCASVLCGPKQTFAVETQPPGADVFVYDSQGSVVFQSTSPCIAELNRVAPEKDRASYIFLIKKQGFDPVQVPLSGHVNSAYLINILSGGIGYAIDPITHAMWTLSPTGIDTRKLEAHKGFELRSDALTVTLEESDTNAAPSQASPPLAIKASPFNN
jgi:hypothetical protein